MKIPENVRQTIEIRAEQTRSHVTSPYRRPETRIKLFGDIGDSDLSMRHRVAPPLTMEGKMIGREQRAGGAMKRLAFS